MTLSAAELASPIDLKAALSWLEQCALFFEARATDERSEDIEWQASVASARNARRIATLLSRLQDGRNAVLEEAVNGGLEKAAKYMDEKAWPGHAAAIRKLKGPAA